MVCFVVPTSVALLGMFLRRKYGWNSLHAQWFTLLFSGGAVFGIVDHMWNGELFASPNLAGDLLLGFAITAALLAVWVAAVWVDSARKVNASKT